MSHNTTIVQHKAEANMYTVIKHPYQSFRFDSFRELESWINGFDSKSKLTIFSQKWGTYAFILSQTCEMYQFQNGKNEGMLICEILKNKSQQK